MFSKACEYAIKACIFVAKSSMRNERVTPKQIADQINSPVAFTAKIMQDLVKSNLVASYRGAYGGFEIEQAKIAEISLSQIVEVIDGDKIYNGCGLGLDVCNENHPCPVHEQYKAIREDLKQLLKTTNLEQLAVGIETGDAFLKT
ncbi:Rrf2 family transcriptional regulator [Psychroserpens sp. XS_ASV72]|uniref:RrF2 family transcriptional regulator n=1 Tax=Psychroserpens sp. XS_ASV72 TaxID=3241293 RepID=UPI0035171C33